MIFCDYLSGMGQTAIAHKLNEMGIPTRQGNLWTNPRIKELLTNSYNYMANGSFALEDMYRISSDGDITRWGDEGRYLLYNGICLREALPADTRKMCIAGVATPAYGSWFQFIRVKSAAMPGAR